MHPVGMDYARVFLQVGRFWVFIGEDFNPIKRYSKKDVQGRMAGLMNHSCAQFLRNEPIQFVIR